MKHHITNNFNHTETFWYINKNAKKPEAKVIHSQNTELIEQSRAKSIGGVMAKITKGIKAMGEMSFFTIPSRIKRTATSSLSAHTCRDRDASCENQVCSVIS